MRRRAISACWSARPWAASSCSRSGPPHGILLNTVFYLPLVLWLIEGALRAALPQGRAAAAPRRARPCRHRPHHPRHRRHPVIVSMTLAGGRCILLRRQCLQAQMPGFAARPRPRRSRRRPTACCWPPMRPARMLAGFVLEGRGLAAAAAAHGDHPGDAVVRAR